MRELDKTWWIKWVDYTRYDKLLNVYKKQPHLGGTITEIVYKALWDTSLF